MRPARKSKHWTPQIVVVETARWAVFWRVIILGRRCDLRRGRLHIGGEPASGDVPPARLYEEPYQCGKVMHTRLPVPGTFCSPRHLKTSLLRPWESSLQVQGIPQSPAPTSFPPDITHAPSPGCTPHASTRRSASATAAAHGSTLNSPASNASATSSLLSVSSSCVSRSSDGRSPRGTTPSAR